MAQDLARDEVFENPRKMLEGTRRHRFPLAAVRRDRGELEAESSPPARAGGLDFFVLENSNSL